MPTVVGVRFKRAGKIYYFDPGNFKLEKLDKVIVETARGIEFGEIVIENRKVPEEELVLPLKTVIRPATMEDIERAKDNKRKQEEAFRICLEKIKEHKLPMKLIDVEYTFDNSKVIFYFTAEGRVDFRELVKSLAAIFRTRIELRQIGVRDEAKVIGGIGSCGRVLCCHAFLGDFAPVSIRMAKDQNLSLNPTKISGICGRLMCCLKYENEIYEDSKEKLEEKAGFNKELCLFISDKCEEQLIEIEEEKYNNEDTPHGCAIEELDKEKDKVEEKTIELERHAEMREVVQIEEILESMKFVQSGKKVETGQEQDSNLKKIQERNLIKEKETKGHTSPTRDYTADYSSSSNFYTKQPNYNYNKGKNNQGNAAQQNNTELVREMPEANFKNNHTHTRSKSGSPSLRDKPLKDNPLKANNRSRGMNSRKRDGLRDNKKRKKNNIKEDGSSSNFKNEREFNHHGEMQRNRSVQEKRQIAQKESSQEKT